MFLRRITITGFKSFANKTVIDLERGITGVVGPNGSGKSNIADAIRWALGEQGKGRLRLSERDEVVFAGSDKRARASFAEVVLLFDNEDGAFPLDLTEVEISRRLYRSGETDYRLAGRSVRLSDIQALLAQAGVGANSYAVIGQGMIDSILMSSPSERKLLFEEAAGIRSPELSREAALRKLSATSANLTRLRDIAAELAPRLGTLEAALGAAEERASLEQRVAELRTNLVSAESAHWNSVITTSVDKLSVLTQSAHRLRHRRLELEHAWRRHQSALSEAAHRREGLQQRLSELEQHRDQAAADLAQIHALVEQSHREAAAALEMTNKLHAAVTDRAGAQGRLENLQIELESNHEASARAAKSVDKAGREVATAQAALVSIRDGTGEGARDQYVDHALQILKVLALGLGTPEFTETQIKLLVHKAGRLLSHASHSGAAELLAELKTAQKHLENVMNKREIAIEHQTNVSIAGRSLEMDQAYQAAEMARIEARIKQLEQELQSHTANSLNAGQLDQAQAAAAASLDSATAQLEQERSQLALLSLSVGDIEAGSKLMSRLEHAKAQILELGAQQHSLILAHADAIAKLKAVSARAFDWGVEIISATAQMPLSKLSDQLARAETLFEARSSMYQEQVGQYEEATQRHTDLTAQIADLELAETDLRQLIGELDKLIRARFNDSFQALAEQFSLYFGRLFEGGKASLELSEGEGSSYGITIKASPAGKRVSAIAALSGGERALAGVALVAAIMRVNPSPFVVLDEIDAALDEANSGRLAAILSELKQYTQLIVITHNRQTMEAAKVLFGVTMNEHNISHLISMRLEQATQLAAR